MTLSHLLPQQLQIHDSSYLYMSCFNCLECPHTHTHTYSYLPFKTPKSMSHPPEFCFILMPSPCNCSSLNPMGVSMCGSEKVFSGLDGEASKVC